MKTHFSKEHADPDIQRFQAMIANYPFTWVNKLDLAVIDGAEAGYFVEADIAEAAAQHAVEVRASAQNSAMRRAWVEYYDGTLAGDDSEFLDALYQSAIQEVQTTTVPNLNSAIYMLRESGRSTQAADVVAGFMKAHADKPPEFFETSAHFHNDDSIEPTLDKAFAKARATYVDPRDPFEVLREMGARQSWDKRDAMLMRKQSADDFERMFEALRGDQVRYSIEAIRKLAREEKHEDDTIERTTTEALKRIATKSPLRARKVARFGVKLDESAVTIT